jgi:nucleoside-diphosphate-sugar epimerase
VPDEESRAVNRDAAVNLGRAALEAGATRFVQASTNLVYGPGRGRPALEEDEPHPPSGRWGSYPAAKAAAEQGLLALDGLDVRVARFAFVYGDGDPHLDEARERTAGWPAHQRLPVVHHADVRQALVLLLYAAAPGSRVYNVSDDAAPTAAEIQALTGGRPPEPAAGETVDDPWFGITDNRRIRDELGFRPFFPTVWSARDAGAL